MVAVIGSGCSEKKPARETGEFESYVQRFEELAKENGHPVEVADIRIAKGEPNPDNDAVLGECNKGSDHPPEIIVDEGYWESANETEREILMMHELGHCVLGRTHKDDWNEDEDRPDSLMSTFNLNDHLYDDHYEEYIAELFKG